MADRMITFGSNSGLEGRLVPVRISMTEALSACYVLTLDLIADMGALDLGDALGRRASVTLDIHENRREIHGVIREARFMGSLPRGLFWYRMLLVPRAALLDLTLRSRVFCTEQPARIADVITGVLTSAEGVQLSAADYATNLHSTAYPLRDMVVQYQETDLAFFSRHAENAGIFYFFQNAGDGEQIVFGDSNLAFPLLSGGSAGSVLLYRPGVGIADTGTALRSVALEQRLVPGSAMLNERYFANPATVLGVDSAVLPGGVGFHAWHEQDGYQESGWGKALAEIRAQEQAVGRTVLTGESDCVALAAGSVFTVAEHESSRINGKYVATSVTHEVWESAEGIEYLPGEAPRGGGYRNRFTAIPFDVPFRPARQTPRPVIAGMIRATIDGVDDARSNIDPLGCYRIIFSFDTEARPPGRSSCPVRLITPYGGPVEGFHFPLRAKTQVMVGFHNGDPDRPVILGPLYDAAQKSVVTHANRSVNMISTVSGITVRLNDGLPSGS